MLHLPATVSLPAAQDLMSGLLSGAAEVSLDVTDYERNLPLAETGVHAFVRLASWRQISLRLKVSRPTHEAAQTLQYLSESPTGFLLCQSASSFVDVADHDCLDELRSLQRTFLRFHNGLLPLQGGFALPVADNVTSAPAASGLLRLESLPEFRENFLYLLTSSFGTSFLRMHGLTSASRFAFEILQNTRDHATTNVAGHPIRGCRFLLVRRVNLVGEGFDSLRSIPVVAPYLDRLSDVYGSHLAELVEITISDSGEGIPARMAGSTEIYAREDFEGQLRWLDSALRDSGTSKRGMSGAGLGLPRAMRAVSDAGGLIVFRTGHLNLHRHYFSGSPYPDKTLQPIPGGRPFFLGTSVTLLLPRLSPDS